MPFILILILSLVACTAPQHPLTYVHPDDPIWQLNPPPPLDPQQAAQR